MRKHVSRNSAQVKVTDTESDDLDLVHASKSGDVAAFEELVKRYDRKLLRIAQHLTHNREDAQDVVQEAFLKAFQHLGQFRENSKFSTWLIRITLNQSLMKLRRQRVTREVSFDNDFQSGEYIVVCHWFLPKRHRRRNPQRPWNWGARFSRKADVPSFLSSVAAQRPK